MISSIRGKVINNIKGTLTIDVNGIGYEVHVPESFSISIQYEDEIQVYTYMALRQDDVSLYGFQSNDDKQMFKQLIKVSGIGPKLGLQILSAYDLDIILGAIQDQRRDIFENVPGIGRKTAEKIIIELRDKTSIVDGIFSGYSVGSGMNHDVYDGLIALGYSVVEAQSAIQYIPSDADESTEERLRIALQYFNSNKT